MYLPEYEDKVVAIYNEKHFDVSVDNLPEYLHKVVSIFNEKDFDVSVDNLPEYEDKVVVGNSVLEI